MTNKCRCLQSAALRAPFGEVSVKGYLKHQQVSHDDMLYPCNIKSATFFWEQLTNLDLILLKQSTFAAAIEHIFLTTAEKVLRNIQKLLRPLGHLVKAYIFQTEST